MIRFSGFGKYIPPHEQTNAEVAQRFGIKEEEIIYKSGIRCRYLAKDEPASSMALKALQEALTTSGMQAKDLNGIIVSTFSGDYLYPNTASRLARDLEINDIFSYDLQANCAGFQTAISVARDHLLANPDAKHVAVVGVAKQSPFLDPNVLETAFFFSDGASAVILSRGTGSASEGVLQSTFKTNGHNYEIVRLRAGGSSFPLTEDLKKTDPSAFYYEHAGLGVWSEVIVEFPKLIRKTLEKLQWPADSVDLFLFHQANLKLIQFLMARLRLPAAKTVTNVEAIGNTADASLGTVLYDAHHLGRLKKPGSRILLASVGAGFVYCVTPYVVPEHNHE
jgi:3-oxoacyl-[acyl-carrier-protein] synthase III